MKCSFCGEKLIDDKGNVSGKVVYEYTTVKGVKITFIKCPKCGWVNSTNDFSKT